MDEGTDGGMTGQKEEGQEGRKEGSPDMADGRMDVVGGWADGKVDLRPLADGWKRERAACCNRSTAETWDADSCCRSLTEFLFTQMREFEVQPSIPLFLS